MAEPPEPNRKGRPRGSGSFAWRAFFQQSTTPVFVLGKGRRLRFANAACETLIGMELADALGMVCSERRHSSPLAAALAPTPEAQAGKPDKVRRAAPTGRSGPPWWDISFMPLSGEDGLIGIVGYITVVGEAIPSTPKRVPASITTLREKHAGQFTFDLFAGTSATSVRLAAQLRHAAESTAPLWLIGERGSGKETAARAIHHNGKRRNAAFVGLDCAGLQPYLLESLLFGHGSILGTDHVGTLYLKDPSALPRDLQQRLAELFLQSAPGTPRLISGSTLTAGELVGEGKLVPTFHTALSVLEITVPSLRERLAELARFVSHFVPAAVVESGVLDVLRVQLWPGNLRELADTLAEAATLATDGPLKTEHLPRELRVRAGLAPLVASKPLPLDAILEAVEKRLIMLAMRKTNNHQGKAAELLGVFRARLGRRLEALKVPFSGSPAGAAPNHSPKPQQ
ncbi:MAG: sigma 54-interacting transcriptional regulator [Planctomycetes bacterium]|nr:sigma 54-interacting transcriptional regulator [Planctomycetota bacterium]